MGNYIVERAVEIHGAKAVYDAAVRRMDGDRKPLKNVGLGANTIADAWEIMQEAHKSLTPSEQASDYWAAQKDLNRDR